MKFEKDFFLMQMVQLIKENSSKIILYEDGSYRSRDSTFLLKENCTDQLKICIKNIKF